MRRLISVITLLALAAGPTVNAAGFEWVDDTLAPHGVTAGDLVLHPGQLAADRAADDQVMNTTLTLLHKLARHGLKSRQLATDEPRAVGFTGANLRVSNRKLRVQFHFRF